jgi:hypothetical protein
MNRERYPTNFLLVLLVYIIVLVIGLNFIFSAIGFGLFGYEDFYYILALVLLPLIFIVIYLIVPRIKVLWGHEHVLRLIITLLVFVSMIFVSLFLLPIMV